MNLIYIYCLLYHKKHNRNKLIICCKIVCHCLLKKHTKILFFSEIFITNFLLKKIVHLGDFQKR